MGMKEPSILFPADCRQLRYASGHEANGWILEFCSPSDENTKESTKSVGSKTNDWGAIKIATINCFLSVQAKRLPKFHKKNCQNLFDKILSLTEQEVIITPLFPS